MATLREYFDTDFTTVLNFGQTAKAIVRGELLEVPVRVHYDFDANAKFASCYLPEGAVLSVCEGLVRSVDRFLSASEQVEIRSGRQGEAPMKSSELPFAGPIFICEIVDRAGVVLPIWHDVTREQVYEYSPALADPVGVRWTLGSDEVVRRLHRAINSVPR